MDNSCRVIYSRVFYLGGTKVGVPICLQHQRKFEADMYACLRSSPKQMVTSHEDIQNCLWEGTVKMEVLRDKAETAIIYLLLLENLSDPKCRSDTEIYNRTPPVQN